MVGNYLTPRLVRTSLLSQKSPLWSIIAMEHPGGVQTWQVTFRFFQRWLENPLERVRWFSQQKTPFFWCFFHVFPHILWLSFPSRVGTSHRCLSWGPHRPHRCRRARQRSTSLSSAASWRSTTRKWRLAEAATEFGPFLGASFGAPRHQLRATIATFIQVHPKDILLPKI